jgi:energy-coupling factor transporter ATP-binding protein EcfA2/uncharacterized membrane protein
MMPDKAFIAERLSFRYGQAEQLAIQDVSFEADTGKVVLIAGSSGCGKSTLLRGINGLIPRSYKGELHGTLRINGHDPAPLSLAQIAQLVGTVLQNPEKQIIGAYVRNEVAFGPENLGWPRRRILAAIDEVLHRLGIAHLRDRETFKLSGGEKQKVALAGVLAMQTKLLLLDEPLASLDPASARETLALLRSLTDDGHALLLVEHRIEDVLDLRPEQVLFMRNGQQVYWGDLAQFEAVADPREVKLPAPLAVEWARRNRPADDLPAPPLPASSTAAPLIEFEHVDFFYEPDQPVLEDVNLTIRQGDVVAILGPNGAGKSTLVKHMIGLLKPCGGQVRIVGQPSAALTTAQIAHTVGYVFQHPGHMLFAPSVREELAFGPRNLGFEQARIEANVARAINLLGLTGMEDRPPLALSYGQQKRVGIAAVVAMESRVLVMDEPTAGQDHRSYTTFMDAIARLQTFDALVFITHDLDLHQRQGSVLGLINHNSFSPMEDAMRTASPNRYTRPLVLLAAMVILSVVLIYVGNFLVAAQGAEPMAGFGWIWFVVIGAAIAYGIYAAFADRPIWEVGTREVVMMAIGAALYAVFSYISNSFQLPSVSQVALRPAAVIPVLFGVLFGPVVGFFTGFVGNVLGDAMSGWVSPTWDIGNGLMGMVAGLAVAFPRSHRSFNGLTITIGAVGVALAVWLMLNPEVENQLGEGTVGNLWWTPLIGVVMVIALRYILRDRPDVAIALLWSAFGVIVGIGFAAIADIWWNGYTPAVAILGEFVPAASTNLINIAILLPILHSAYIATRARTGRA